MKWTYEIITHFTELKLIKYIGRSEMLKIFRFWHTHSNMIDWKWKFKRERILLCIET